MRPIDANRVLNDIGLYMAENAYLNDTALDALKKVVDWVEDAPTIEPYGTWIPCSERLPKVEGSYITTTEYGAVRVNHFYTRNNTWGYKSNRTIAWMPLPEPWKGDEL